MDGVKEENMNKLVIASFALVFVTISTCSQALSQSKCSMTEANSPSVRGIRLGMGTEQLLALFPGSTKRWAKQMSAKEMRQTLEKAKAATSSEPVYLSFEPSSDADKEQFAGVQSVSAGIYKGRVMDFNIKYVGG